VDRFPRLEVELAFHSANTHSLRLQAFEVHLDSAIDLVEKRSMPERVEVEFSAQLAIDAG
jgi:hypothetical protein